MHTKRATPRQRKNFFAKRPIRNPVGLRTRVQRKIGIPEKQLEAKVETINERKMEITKMNEGERAKEREFRKRVDPPNTAEYELALYLVAKNVAARVIGKRNKALRELLAVRIKEALEGDRAADRELHRLLANPKIRANYEEVMLESRRLVHLVW